MLKEFLILLDITRVETKKVIMEMRDMTDQGMLQGFVRKWDIKNGKEKTFLSIFFFWHFKPEWTKITSLSSNMFNFFNFC